ELALLTLAAIPIGMAIGYGLGWSISKGLETELYRIPFVIAPNTYWTSIAIVVIASVVSGLIVRRKLDRLDLIAVLKTRT
ncbi:MAG: FtsX-like permease family protein, partial [Verrucomicrobiota bacterium]